MSRRRSHSDDDEVSARKRRRTSEPMDIEDRLESLITRVGEKSTSSLESNLEGLAGVLEADLPNYKNKILRILCDCVLKMPEKTTVYTTLVGLLNAKNYNCGGEFMELMVRNLKEALKICHFEDARIMIRFLADLVNCHVIAAPSLMSMFDNFVEVTLEDNIPQVRSDWYVYAVLSSLPWVGRELYEKKEAEFDRMLSAIDNYLSKRLKVHLPALQVWSSEVPHPQEEYLDCLWAQIKKLRTDKWQEKQILRPYLAFDGVLCEALQHNLPQILLPPHNEDSVYPFPYVCFRLFDYTDCPEGPQLPNTHSIERYLIEENLHRILNQYHLERKECAAQLLSVPDKNLIPLNYMIVEVIFAQLFNLPLNPFLEIFYGSLIIELCKLQPSSMPQVLAQAAEMLYERIDTMNTTCIDRFANWFSYHLSNFQYRWSWEDWATCQNMDPEHPKAKFVVEVLNKCMRLSYYQRVVEIMPENFGVLIPEKNLCIYKYGAENSESLPGKVTADQLTSAIKGKCTAEEVLAVLKDLPNPLQDDEGEPSHNPLKIDVFVQVLLNLGSKSISHSFAAIAKFHYVFKTLADTEEAQICVLRSMFEIWRKHQQMMNILVDKMLKTQIVECSSVANWLFSSEMSPEFTKTYIWEIMTITIKMMNKHVFKLQIEVEDAREKLEDTTKDEIDMDIEKDEKDSPTEEMLERMEERLEYAQSEQKNLFLIIFQRFIIILTEHLVRCESEGVDYNNLWYRWAIGRLQQIFLIHHEQVYKYINTLETLLFTSDIDLHILEIFQQFSSLRS